MLTVAKVRVFTPVVVVKNNMENAKALAVEDLVAGKVRIGLLDNTKPNCALLFAHATELLADRTLAASTFNLTKIDTPGNSSSSSATEAAFKQLEQNSDFVITGLGN